MLYRPQNVLRDVRGNLDRFQCHDARVANPALKNESLTPEENGLAPLD
jgi:hypothetical protein